MAKAPCARLTKFMSPIVTERPMLIRNSRLPYAMPSKRTPMRFRATVNPWGKSRASSVTAALASGSVVEEHGFVLALQDHVPRERSGSARNRRRYERATPCGGHALQRGILGIRRIA